LHKGDRNKENRPQRRDVHAAFSASVPANKKPSQLRQRWPLDACRPSFDQQVFDLQV
jgi:hypothetical protein